LIDELLRDNERVMAIALFCLIWGYGVPGQMTDVGSIPIEDRSRTLHAALYLHCTYSTAVRNRRQWALPATCNNPDLTLKEPRFRYRFADCFVFCDNRGEVFFVDTPITVAVISAAVAVVLPAISFYLTKKKEQAIPGVSDLSEWDRGHGFYTRGQPPLGCGV
jgi:hypothetical protein